MSKDDNDGVAGVPACFFFANSVAKTTTGYKVCKACEVITGPGGIDGGQKLFGLWRIYCTSTKARNNLITNGITIDDQFIPIIGVNPKVVKGASDNPSVKVIIGNIAKSVSNEEIEKSLKEIEGVKIRSKMFDEHYRDEDGKLSLFKSGRRFVYIDAPPKPLPTQFQVGKWTPSLYHYGQKAKNVTDNPIPNDTEAVKIGASENISVVTSSPKDKEVVSENNPDSGNDQGETNISSENEPVATSHAEVEEPKCDQSSTTVVNKEKQTNIGNFFNTPTAANSPSNRKSRPKTRIPSKKGRTCSDSASRKRGLNVNDFQVAPYRKSRCTQKQDSSIDFFDFTPQFSKPSGTGDGSVD